MQTKTDYIAPLHDILNYRLFERYFELSSI